MNHKKLRFSFRKKMLVSIIPVPLTIFAIFGITLNKHFHNIFETKIKNEVSLISQDFANRLEDEFTVYFNVEKQFNTILSRFEDVDINSKRKFYANLTRDLLEKNEGLLAMWFDFDHNAFDGEDYKYRNSDYSETGRYAITWFRDTAAKLKLQYLTKYDEAEESKMEHMCLPREQKKTIIVEPHKYSFSKNANKVLMTSIVSPIFNKDNKVVGVSAVEVSLDSYVKFVEQIKPYEIGYAKLYSPEGRYLVHPDREAMTRTALEGPSETLSDSIRKKILRGELYKNNFIDEKGKRLLTFYFPIQTKAENKYMVLAVYVPFEILTAEIRQFFGQFFVMIGIALALVVITTTIIATKISRPLKLLSREAKKLIQGDFAVNFDYDSNDEIGDLTRTLSSVKQSVQEVIYEINKITVATATGNLNIRGDITKFQGVYSSLIEGINETVSILTEPLDLSLDIITVVDISSLKISFVAGAVEENIGFTVDEYMNMSLDEIFPPSSFAKVKNIIGDKLQKHIKERADELGATLEVQQYHKDGSLIWVEISAKMTFNEDYVPDKIVAVVRVVEQRKRMELALRESESKYSLMANTIRDIMCFIDARTFKYLHVTGACYELTGFTPEEIATLTIEDIMPAKSFELVASVIGGSLQKYYEGKIDVPQATFEVQQYHKNGSLIWIETSAKMTFNEDNTPDKIITINRVIDGRKANEAKILEQKEELEHQQVELIQQKEALEHQQVELIQQKEELELLNATKDKFFSIIAHDLKNPFSALLNTAEMLSDNKYNLTEIDVKQNINLINSASKYIYRLFENLLEWARSSSGAITYYPSLTNVNIMINDCVNELRAQATVKNISVQYFDISADSEVFCDMNMIDTVLRNLISNAIKFSFNGATVEVVVSDNSEDFMQISVRDFGVGIDEKDIDKLFRIDSKVSTLGTAKEHGTGLGLIICKEFIDKHNSKIWVESEKGKGTTFFFTLPKQA